MLKDIFVIPDSTQIGPFEIKVIYEEGYFRKSDNLGEWDPSAMVIKLDRDMKENNEQRLLTTFIHEIIEAVNSIYRLSIPHDKIDIFENGLTQALMPILMKK